MSEQPKEENTEEPTKDKSADKTLRQKVNLPTSEEISEAQRIIKTFPYSDYNEFLRHAGHLRDTIASVQTAGATGLSQPASNVLLSSFNPNLGRKILTHEEEVNQLKSVITDLTQNLINQSIESKAYKETYEQHVQKLIEKQKLSHLIDRVNTTAQEKLLDDPDFRTLFEQQSPCPTYVMSIDIRRSTELMLKAREPQLFAEFIIGLAIKLRQVILDDYGIFDKFTGDGILSFFPEFYSGEDAGFRAVAAASQCHKIFEDHYKEHRHCFISVLKDIGLGIGLDYGTIQMVQIGGEFTVVGTPVVYACRMAGAEAGQTYLNYPAYEKIFEHYSAYCDFDECDIEIKHEGTTLAYRARPNGKLFQAAIPDWNKSAGDHS